MPETKLDAKFYGDIWKAKDGSRVPDDEYIVFLAKDDALPEMLAFYENWCVTHGADDAQVMAVRRMRNRLRAWREAHPDRCKIPDAAGEVLLDA